ncbi:MAG: acetate--CoA ligase family protein [Patescibacteria group bacterium]
MSLENFFNPRAVAVIGASADKTKLGRQILDNIIGGGFKGPVYPLNLKEKKIAGLKAYASLENLPRSELAALLVIIAIPAPFVTPEIKKCGQLGIKNIIIISAGFKEAGPAGAKLEKTVATLALKYHLNILGPNCLGLINTWQRLNATFAAADKETGNVALLSQSGAIGAAALDWLHEKDFNFGYFISLGNKAVLDENKIIEYLATDKKIDLIVAYLEEIKEGTALMHLISRLAKHKPVAILKAGTSPAGGQMALSHTGALAGSTAAVKTGLDRAGAIWLENLEELFNLLLVFRKESWHNHGRQDLSIITNAGGVAVLTADEISRQNVPFSRSLDLLGDAQAAHYQKAINKTLADKKVNNLLVLLTPQTATEPFKTAQVIAAAARKYPHKLIMASFVGGAIVNQARDFLEKHNIPSFDYPEMAVRSFKKLIAYKNIVKTVKTYRQPAVKVGSPLKKADYLKSFGLLKKYRLAVVKTTKYSPAQLKNYHYPLVLKIVGPAFNHKSDRGGVIVNLENAVQLKLAASRLVKQAKKDLKDRQNYLVVQPRVKKALEIIIGFKRDVSFGPIMIIGLGGIYTEVFKEVKLATSDLDLKAARELIAGLKIYPILSGARGQKKYDLKGLARALVSLARLANEHPEIKEMDINPLFVGEKKVLASDVRIII